MTRNTGDGWRLNLLGMWQLFQDQQRVHVAPRQQRLIAALALLSPRPRAALAGVLWPESVERHAAGNLRAALWRIRHDLPGLLECDDEPLCLSPLVCTDISAFLDLTHCVGSPGWTDDPDLLHLLSEADLLPGWYDDWVRLEQERVRQQRTAALQVLSGELLALGETSRALEAAQAAVSIDPFNEMSQTLLIQVHLSMGNHAGAAQQFHHFKSLLESELGVEPSRGMQRLVGTITPR